MECTKTAYHQTMGHPIRWLHREKPKDPRQNPPPLKKPVPLRLWFWLRGPTGHKEVGNWTCQSTQTMGHPIRWLNREKPKDPRQNPPPLKKPVPLRLWFWLRGPTGHKEVGNWTCQLSNITDTENHEPAGRGGNFLYAPVPSTLVGKRHWRTTSTG